MITVDGGSQEQRELAEAAAQVVEKHVGRIGQVRLVFTDSRGMADLSCRAELDLMPEMSALVRKNRVKALRESRRAAGVTHLTRSGSLVLINTDWVRTDPLACTLPHELTHSWQFTNSQNRTAHLRFLRQCCGIERIPEPEYRKHLRHMGRQEDEGKRAERLARHLK